MKMYHALPRHYYDQQTHTGDFVCHWHQELGWPGGPIIGIWMTPLLQGALRASQHSPDELLIMEIDVTNMKTEKFTDVSSKYDNGDYYMLRESVIPKDKFTLIGEYDAISQRQEEEKEE